MLPPSKGLVCRGLERAPLHREDIQMYAQYLKESLLLFFQGMEGATKTASHSLLGHGSFLLTCLPKVLAKVRDSNNGWSVSSRKP